MSELALPLVVLVLEVLTAGPGLGPTSEAPPFGGETAVVVPSKVDRSAPQPEAVHGPSSGFAPEPGHPVFRMLIRAIELTEVVRQGTDAEQLERGPGHYPECGRYFSPPYCSDFDEVWPGERGRVVVGGHRTLADADFFNVGELRRGNRVFIRAAWGRFVNVIRRREIVDPDNRTVIVPDVRKRELVLVTCHPKYSAARRLIIYAELEARRMATVGTARALLR